MTTAVEKSKRNCPTILYFILHEFVSIAFALIFLAALFVIYQFVGWTKSCGRV